MGYPLLHSGNSRYCVWNVMAYAQKPDFVFRRKVRVHLNRRGRQFSRLLAAEVCASAVVMLDTPCSEVVWRYWLPTPFASSTFTSPPVRHCAITFQLHSTTLTHWVLAVLCSHFAEGEYIGLRDRQHTEPEPHVHGTSWSVSLWRMDRTATSLRGSRMACSVCT
jgi:acyl-ACP thioesterase